MSELILVRHGQASFGAESYDKLSATGVEQAKILAQHWQGLSENFDHIYSGTLLANERLHTNSSPLSPERPKAQHNCPVSMNTMATR